MRFKQFQDNWSAKRLSDITEVVGGGTPDTTDSTLWNGDIQWFTPTEVGHSKYVSTSIRTISQLGLQKSSAKILPSGSILLSSRATVGECSIAQRDCTTNQGFQSLIPKKSVNNEFLYYLAQTQKRHFIKYASGSTFLEISNSEIKKTKCAVPSIEEQTEIATFLSAIDNKIAVQNKIIPSIEEQTEIATFLSAIDNKIAVQNKIIEDLKVLKKELCNKVFSKGSAVRLGDFIEEVTTRNKSNSFENVLSVSNKMGFIKQSEQFEDRTVASENKSNYKVVTEGCFAYNPARINVGSIALLSTYKIGIISPMYVCFKTKSSLDSEYLNFYYQSGFFYKELQKKLEGSVRQCLTYENMSEIFIQYIGIEEQKKIASTINKFVKLIAAEEKYLKLLQKQKSYFLNAMFI